MGNTFKITSALDDVFLLNSSFILGFDFKIQTYDFDGNVLNSDEAMLEKKIQYDKDGVYDTID